METIYDSFALGSTFCLGITPQARPVEALKSYPILRGQNKLLNDFVKCEGDYRGMYKELFFYVRKYLGNQEDAEDVMNEIWAAVKVKRDKFDPRRGKFRPWLYTVATHACIDFLRKNKKHKKVSSLDGMISSNPDVEDEDSGYEHRVSCLNPLDKMDIDEKREKIKESLDRLPPHKREIINLIYFDGLKYREAAEILEIPVGTVKSRLRASLKELEKLVKKGRSAA